MKKKSAYKYVMIPITNGMSYEQWLSQSDNKKRIDKVGKRLIQKKGKINK